MNKKLLQTTLLAITLLIITLNSSTQVLAADSPEASNNASTASAEWTILVDGGIQNPINITLTELAAMPRTTVPAVLVCPGYFTIDGNWTGVKLALILEKAGFDPNATTVKFSAQDGYQISLSTKDAMREDVIIAYEKDGEPLPEATRLVVPDAIGGLWISNITQIAVPNSAAGTVPEGLTIAVIILLSSIAAAIGTFNYRKQKRIAK